MCGPRQCAVQDNARSRTMRAASVATPLATVIAMRSPITGAPQSPGPRITSGCLSGNDHQRNWALSPFPPWLEAPTPLYQHFRYFRARKQTPPCRLLSYVRPLGLRAVLDGRLFRGDPSDTVGSTRSGDLSAETVHGACEEAARMALQDCRRAHCARRRGSRPARFRGPRRHPAHRARRRRRDRSRSGAGQESRPADRRSVSPGLASNHALAGRCGGRSHRGRPRAWKRGATRANAARRHAGSTDERAGLDRHARARPSRRTAHRRVREGSVLARATERGLSLALSRRAPADRLPLDTVRAYVAARTPGACGGRSRAAVAEPGMRVHRHSNLV